MSDPKQMVLEIIRQKGGSIKSHELSRKAKMSISEIDEILGNLCSSHEIRCVGSYTRVLQKGGVEEGRCYALFKPIVSPSGSHAKPRKKKKKKQKKRVKGHQKRPFYLDYPPPARTEMGKSAVTTSSRAATRHNP